MQKKLFGLLLLAVITGLIASLACAPAATTPAATTPAAAENVVITIGDLPNLTGAYAATQSCYVESNGGAVKLANEKNYIPGVTLKYEWVDAATDPAKAMTAYKKLLASTPRPSVIIDHSTAIGVALKQTAAADKMPIVEGGVSNEMLIPPGWVFYYGSPYTCEVGAYVNWYKSQWKESRAPRFAALTWDIPYGRAWISDESMAYIKAQGFEIVGQEFIPAVPSDTTPQLLRLKDAKVDCCFGAMYPSALAVVLKDANKLDMTGTFTWGGVYAVSLAELVGYVGPLANGCTVTSTDILPDMWKDKSPYMQEVWDKNGTKLAPATMFAFANAAERVVIGMGAIKAASEKVGAKNVDGQAVYNALTQMKSFDPWGVGAPITYSETKRFGQDTVYITQVKDGKVIQIGTARVPDLLPGGKDVPAK
jgi:branched-chain amino acid transport system substrate-binding protein